MEDGPASSAAGSQPPEAASDPGHVKTEDIEDAPRLQAVEVLLDSSAASIPLHPVAIAASKDAEPVNDPANMAMSKKKGAVATAKKAPKRPKGATKASQKKKSKASRPDSAAPKASDNDSSMGEESDNGPYCICRGPDDHRWMIGCERCEDWFHGECIHITKEVGESLVERFICPNCTKGDLVTIYKKTCSLPSCRKAARLKEDPASTFCSNDHAQLWWERLVAKLPKTRTNAELNDQLIQGEFMALLGHGLATAPKGGPWHFFKAPFEDVVMKNSSDETDELPSYLTSEERSLLENASVARSQLAREDVLCHQMTTLVELAQDRRRRAISAGRLGDDMCGYDQRLDTVLSRDAFSAFASSSSGQTIFTQSRLDDPLDGGDEIRDMCEKKRCKIHAGWQKMLPLGVKHHIRELASQAHEIREEERIVREAARERSKRLLAESNWVECVAD